MYRLPPRAPIRENRYSAVFSSAVESSRIPDALSKTTSLLSGKAFPTPSITHRNRAETPRFEVSGAAPKRAYVLGSLIGLTEPPWHHVRTGPKGPWWSCFLHSLNAHARLQLTTPWSRHHANPLIGAELRGLGTAFTVPRRPRTASPMPSVSFENRSYRPSIS